MAKVYQWNGRVIHPYLIMGRRKVKHPVRMFAGGLYLTEDLDIICDFAGDMGIWALNERDYKIFKENLFEKVIDKSI